MLPAELADVQLDAEVRQDLRGLRKDVADVVAQHLVAAGTLLEVDPEQALAHARYARSKASRLAAVREATGVAAYYAGEWAEAIAELRAARRMGGGPGHLAVLADAERALGRPERALEIARGPEVADLTRGDAIELIIVAAGARRDLGEHDAAVVALQVPELESGVIGPWSARLRYAYADSLLAAGRRDDAVRWFLRTVEIDEAELTDAGDRLAVLADDDLPDGALPGDDLPGDDLPGDDLPGDDLPGDDLPGDDLPGAELVVVDTAAAPDPVQSAAGGPDAAPGAAEVSAPAPGTVGEAAPGPDVLVDESGPAVPSGAQEGPSR